MVNDIEEYLKACKALTDAQARFFQINSRIGKVMRLKPTEEELDAVQSLYKSVGGYNDTIDGFIKHWRFHYKDGEEYRGYVIKQSDGYIQKGYWYACKEGQSPRHGSATLEACKASIDMECRASVNAPDVMRRLGVYDLSYEERCMKRDTIYDRRRYYFRDEMAMRLQRMVEKSKKDIKDWNVRIIRGISALNNDELRYESRRETEFTNRVGDYVEISDGEQRLEWGVR